MSVTVVDNERDIVTTIARGLKNIGYSVHTFTDPMKALNRFEDGGPACHVLVSDIRMPNLTGFELSRRVKDLRPEMKIILMSAFEINTTEFRKVLPHTTVDAFIQKPFHIPKMVETITNLLK